MPTTCVTKKACVDCSQFADAFSCLRKLSVSEIVEATELEMQSAFDNKTEKILIPASFRSRDGAVVTKSIDIDKLLKIIDGKIKDAISSGV